MCSSGRSSSGGTRIFTFLKKAPTPKRMAELQERLDREVLYAEFKDGYRELRVGTKRSVDAPLRSDLVDMIHTQPSHGLPSPDDLNVIKLVVGLGSPLRGLKVVAPRAARPTPNHCGPSKTRRCTVTGFDPAEVSDYQYLWTTHKADYVLLQHDGGEDAGLLIVNITRKYPEAKLFSDDRLGATIKQHMLNAGVPIVTQSELDDMFRRTSADVARIAT
jgi:hypothetical protein